LKSTSFPETCRNVFAKEKADRIFAQKRTIETFTNALKKLVEEDVKPLSTQYVQERDGNQKFQDSDKKVISTLPTHKSVFSHSDFVLWVKNLSYC